MPRVKFVSVGLEVEVEEGVTILEASRLVGAPQGDRCGGVCACSTCHVYVVEGYDELEELAEAEDEELDILDKAFDVRSNSRLGCQAKVLCDIAVEISAESIEAFIDEHPQERERVEALCR